jgi:alpha-tubulin suppressor-like RCC1 family protein
VAGAPGPAVAAARPAVSGPAVSAGSAVSAGPVSAVSISAGGDHSCAIEGGAAYCWGNNDDGELGTGSTGTGSVIPVPVTSTGALAGQTLVQIAAGDTDTCAVSSAGAAYCWGRNQDGELGDGTTASSSVPVPVHTSGVLAGKRLTQITAADGYTCALDSTGAAYCWGLNAEGGLGDGSYADSSVPVAVDTSGVLAGQTLVQIEAAATGHTCVLDSAGAAFCWGDDTFGEDGDGTTTSTARNRPVAVSTGGVLAGQALTQLGIGEYQACALTSAGAAFCWGLDSNGELGNGSTASSSVPVAVDTSGVLAGRKLAQIGAGAGNYTCAVGATGAAYCWGANGDGQLGDASTAGSGVPVAVDASGVLAGRDLTQITAGYFHTCAADSRGATYCWGDNTRGDLGRHGLTGSSDVPVLAGPQAPSAVTVSPGATSAVVSWMAPASLDGGRLAGYTATASPGGAGCSATATSCTITGLTGGTSYQVSVVARTTAGVSGASDPAGVTPGSAGPIVSGYRGSKCVAALGGATAPGTKVVLSSCDGSAGQGWIAGSDGTLQDGGARMSVHGASQASKALIELDPCDGSGGQQWNAVSGTLVNPASGKCLDDPGFSLTDGTQLEIYTCNGGANQQWRLP